MAGVKGKSGRVGGNPGIEKWAYTTDRAEPCSERIQVRLPLSLKRRVQALPDWQERVRQLLDEHAPKLDDSV
jgi:hypothetical protein